MKQIILRSKKILPRIPFTLLVLLTLCAALFACSGGGGGSGGSTPGASYTGSTAQALITSDNSGTLLEESFQGAMTSDSMVPFSASAAGTQQASTTPMPLVLQAAFADSLADVIDAPGSASRAPMASSTGTDYGDCGGTASYTASYNESTGIFSGIFNYSGFCAGGVTLSGSATFAGRINTDPDATTPFDYFTFTFNNLTTTVEGQTNTVNGTLECDFQGSDVLITTDMVVTQSSSGLVCWLNNYTVQTSGSQMEISGRYYDPVHGWVDFVTVEPLIISAFSDYPSTGLIEFTGANGPLGQPTKARLRAMSTTTCQVTADFDGDGIFEYDSTEIPWTDL